VRICIDGTKITGDTSTHVQGTDLGGGGGASRASKGPEALLFIYRYVDVYIYRERCMHIHVYICVCVWIYICIYIYVCLYMYSGRQWQHCDAYGAGAWGRFACTYVYICMFTHIRIQLDLFGKALGAVLAFTRRSFVYSGIVH